MEFVNSQACECRFHHKIDQRSAELDLSEYQIEENERLFLISNIRSEEAKEVCFRPIDIIGKIWVNGEVVYNHTGPFRLQLNRGDNVVVIEYAELRKTYSIRISETDYDLSLSKELIEEYMDRWIRNRVYVVCESVYAVNLDIHMFYLMTCDWIKVSKGTPVSVVVKNDDGKILDCFEVSIGQKNAYQFANVKKDTNNMLHFEMKYRDMEGQLHELRHVILVHPLTGLIESLEKQIALLRDESKLKEEDQLQLDGLKQGIEAIHELKPGFLTEKELRIVKEYKTLFSQACEKIKQGQSYRDAIIEQKVGDGFFCSKLDDSLERYTVLLPENYSDQKKYPLVVLLPVGRYELELSAFRDLFFDQLNEEVILATYSCRGVVMGSYIGEAAFLEGLEIMKQRFQIDEDRIYLSGYSNGAYAAWALAQAYPDQFAGIAAYAGAADPDKLKNLMNISILNVCGDEDYLIDTAYIRQTNILSGFKYKGMLEPRSNHWDTKYFHHHLSSIRWLLQHKREAAPKQIYFRTEKARHRVCHWIEITEFADGKLFSEIAAEIIGDTIVRIHTQHIREFEVTLPDYVNHTYVKLIIDDQITVLEHRKQSRLRFRKKSDAFELQQERISWRREQNSSMGMGILDIYMDRLKIVVPDHYSSAEEELSIVKVANAYAKPKTAGWDPNIYVQYPILPSKQLTKQDLDHCNLICIGSRVRDHVFLSKIQSQLRIKLFEDGYSSNDRFTEGHYCVQFIQANPMNPKKKILVIFSNHPPYFNKNIYTRKMIVPIYASGIHPYLNKEVIMFSGSLKGSQLEVLESEIHTMFQDS
ncbi:prolyl oligopeptidase family serine peptidase [Paenibacillus puerhi]|uniref:prolyl oligopeptidase family serine peptidase n=1 Tax=Paenibacillus puerhi TaxID=2692622 RepID=UPI0013597E43|nr:prolyl oligopeptidase family serine peptidase [Paenibacillus puerhi]